jgi:hypothetical protein
MQSVSVRRSHSGRARRRVELGAAVLVLSAALAIGASCSVESYHANRAGLSTGTGGGGGVAATAGASGGVAGAGGAAGDGSALAGAGGGLAGDNGGAGMGAAGSSVSGSTGAAGAAGMGAAGAGGAGTGAAGMGAAGTGAAGTGAAGMGAAGTGAAGMGAAGTGAAGMGAAGTGAAGTGTTAPLTLPLTVSDHYAPSGGMGDAAVVGAVTIGTDGAACSAAPAAALKGACYTVTYKPQPIVAPATSTWAGFYWQYPDNNWGTTQPLTVATGAKDVSFYAKGMAGGESIEFEAGGIMNQTMPFADGFSVNQTIKLTTTWTKYTLSMTGKTYAGGVLGAFAWVAQAPNANTVTFFVTGIVWE